MDNETRKRRRKSLPSLSLFCLDQDDQWGHRSMNIKFKEDELTWVSASNLIWKD